MFAPCSLGCAALIVTAGISLAQSPPPRGAWFTQNYHLTGPVGGGETQPDDPRAELDDIQRTVLAILRKANFEGDYEAALAASAQAAANTQMRAAMAARKQTSEARPAPAQQPARSQPVMSVRRYTARPAQNPDAQAH